MALSLEKIKNDFAKNKKRAAVLGVLVLVLAGFSVKAYFEMAPRQVAADGSIPTAQPAPTSGDGQLSAAESEARIRQSKELWTALRLTKPEAVTPGNAFTFNASFFAEDPNRPRRSNEPDRIESPIRSGTPTVNTAEDYNRKVAAVQAKASRILLMSTVPASGNSKPIAVISIPPKIQGIYTIGQTIGEFEIIAIKQSEVVLKLDDVQVVKKIADTNQPVVIPNRDQ